jgi:geranylgeranyl pyrophosphate synthase
MIPDDIMDKAPLRRGKATVHTNIMKAALLASDAMMVKVIL